MLIDSGDSRPVYTATPGRVANLKPYRRVTLAKNRIHVSRVPVDRT